MYSSARGRCCALSSARCLISRVGSRGAIVLGVSTWVKGRSCASRCSPYTRRVPSTSASAARTTMVATVSLCRTQSPRSKAVPPYTNRSRLLHNPRPRPPAYQATSSPAAGAPRAKECATKTQVSQGLTAHRDQDAPVNSGPHNQQYSCQIGRINWTRNRHLTQQKEHLWQLFSNNFAA